MQPAISQDTERILLIRLSALGDVVYALPALDAIRRHCPRAVIAWAVEEAAASLLAGHPQIDELIVVPRKKVQCNLASARLLTAAGQLLHLRKGLKARRFDWAIDLQGNLRSALLARFSGARHTAGYGPPCSREHSYLLLNRPVHGIDPTIHKINRGLELLKRLGAAVDGARGVIPRPSDEGRHVVDALLAQAGFTGSFALLHPGVSRFGSFKQWPIDEYVELAEMLRQKGVNVVVSAGPGEEPLANRVAARVPEAFAVSGLCLPEMAELIRRASVFVGSDTGPTQVAWMAGTPTVALMGPKDTRVYGPLGEPHKAVVADVPCRPCMKRTCANNRCMKEIAAEAVLEAATSIMRR